MQKTEGGWELPYVLAAGNYEYNFIVDRQWITDPDNPFRVINGGIVNSLRVVKPNYNFVLNDYPDAKKVIVTGNFSGWSTDNYNMVKLAGKWVFPIYLKPGKYTYKFIQDGNWLEDPANDEWETNQYGTVNSVLWIEP
jgi:hypothetical protein